MSRGLGRVQRATLAILERHASCYSTATYLAAVVYNVKPGPDGMRYVSSGQVSGVNRALRGLLLARKVDRLGYDSSGNRKWMRGSGETHGRTLRQIAQEVGIGRSTVSRARAELNKSG